MAVTITASALKVRLELADASPDEQAAGLDPASDLLAVASALVTGYAANAPDAVSNESVFRVAGWLNQRGAGAPDSLSAGGVRMMWRNTQGRNALRLSRRYGPARVLASSARYGDRLMRWPWQQQKTEVRNAQPFTDAIVAALASGVSGNAASPAASAALEAAAGHISRVSPSLPWKGHRTWYGMR